MHVQLQIPCPFHKAECTVFFFATKCFPNCGLSESHGPRGSQDSGILVPFGDGDDWVGDDSSRYCHQAPTVCKAFFCSLMYGISLRPCPPLETGAPRILLSHTGPEAQPGSGRARMHSLLPEPYTLLPVCPISGAQYWGHSSEQVPGSTLENLTTAGETEVQRECQVTMME